MAKILDGTLKTWQDTETIHASEYNQEREIMRAAINDNHERVSSLEGSTAGLLLGTAQLSKITDDTGGAEIYITSILGDVLAELLELGKGMHTFYAVSGSKNLPPSNVSIRGIAHFTDDTHGWVYATDYNGYFYTNYYTGNKWVGWKEYVSTDMKQEQLWSGVMYPIETQTITPSKKLGDCRTGWLLVWSDYDAGQGPNDFNWATTYVPKNFPTFGGTNFMATVPSYSSADGATTISVVKQLSITNTTITGNTSNDGGDVNDVVLRKVLEV